jgi:hypothetical protein
MASMAAEILWLLGMIDPVLVMGGPRSLTAAAAIQRGSSGSKYAFFWRSCKKEGA